MLARSAILSLVAIGLQPVLAAISGCSNPGDHMCSVITAGGAFGDPLSGASDSGAYVDISNGACESIVSSGSLQTESPGFYADLHTTYGTELRYWADDIGLGNIHGINFEYLATGKWYYQSGCQQRQVGSDPAYEVVQCNFPC
ncbi:hypothetical protein BJX99DRAFT_252881 [Aspergillus californicus]